MLPGRNAWDDEDIVRWSSHEGVSAGGLEEQLPMLDWDPKHGEIGTTSPAGQLSGFFLFYIDGINHFLHYGLR